LVPRDHRIHAGQRERVYGEVYCGRVGLSNGVMDCWIVES
jgi:hypothetical protein